MPAMSNRQTYRKGPVLLRGTQIPAQTTDARLLDRRGRTEWLHADPWRVLRIQSEFGQGPEALDELRLNAHDPPRVGVEPVGVGVTAQQSRVGGLGGDLGAAQHHWSLAVGLT